MIEYKRLLLKLSGEALAGSEKMGFDDKTCSMVANQVSEIVGSGVEVAIVIGGGNFWRGRTSDTLDRVKADQIGMLATIMNCIYMSEALASIGVATVIMTPFSCGGMSELFSKDNAIEAMMEGKVVLLAGGTGHPFFSTDTATALRAAELGAEIILQARNIDGVYDSDPKFNPRAKKYAQITYQEMIDKKLKILDFAASALCMDNHIPSLIFSLEEEDSIVNCIKGKFNGTVVSP